MQGDPLFEAKLWRLSSRVWIGVAVTAFALAVQAVVRKR